MQLKLFAEKSGIFRKLLLEGQNPYVFFGASFMRDPAGHCYSHLRGGGTESPAPSESRYC